MRGEASPEDTPETNAVRLDEFCNNTWENHYLAMREHARTMERQRDALLDALRQIADTTFDDGRTSVEIARDAISRIKGGGE